MLVSETTAQQLLSTMLHTHTHSDGIPSTTEASQFWPYSSSHCKTLVPLPSPSLPLKQHFCRQTLLRSSLFHLTTWANRQLAFFLGSPLATTRSWHNEVLSTHLILTILDSKKGPFKGRSFLSCHRGTDLDPNKALQLPTSPSYLTITTIA